MENKSEQNDKVVITVPKGKVLKDFAFFCKKHGNLGKSSGDPAVLMIKTKTVDATGVEIEKPNAFCLACLNEYLEKLLKEGHLNPVAIVPVVANAEENKNQESS